MGREKKKVQIPQNRHWDGLTYTHQRTVNNYRPISYLLEPAKCKQTGRRSGMRPHNISLLSKLALSIYPNRPIVHFKFYTFTVKNTTVDIS